MIVAVSLPLYVHVRHSGAGEDALVRRLFWLGVLIGLTWEVPIFLSAMLSATPVVRFITPPPLHPAVFLVAHALWDGGLFLAGLVLLRGIFGAGILRRFRWAELAVLILWGQLSELLVEVTSVSGGGWVYVAEHRYNVALFTLHGRPITLLPQLIWLVAPVAYYLVACRLSARHGDRLPHTHLSP